MKRRVAARPTPREVDVPAELAAGACIEVWADPVLSAWMAEDWLGPACSARQRYNEALACFLDGIGVAPHDTGSVPLALRDGALRIPWSFDFLLVHAPDDLADRLAYRGLPPDWRPSRPAVHHHSRGTCRTPSRRHRVDLNGAEPHA